MVVLAREKLMEILNWKTFFLFSDFFPRGDDEKKVSDRIIHDEKKNQNQAMKVKQ